MNKLTAWHILGAHALRSVEGLEDELVALDALTVVATSLELPQAKIVSELAQTIRSADAQRRELREELDGQLNLNLGGAQG